MYFMIIACTMKENRLGVWQSASVISRFMHLSNRSRKEELLHRLLPLEQPHDRNRTLKEITNEI